MVACGYSTGDIVLWKYNLQDAQQAIANGGIAATLGGGRSNKYRLDNESVQTVLLRGHEDR